MKPGTAKRKGRETENGWVAWLRRNGWPDAERRRLTGSADQGDIAGVYDQTIEVKSAAEWQPMKWLRELDVEQANTGDTLGYVVARPKGKNDPDDWVILMRPGQLLELLKEAGRCGQA